MSAIAEVVPIIGILESVTGSIAVLPFSEGNAVVVIMPSNRPRILPTPDMGHRKLP